jgi:hypothetical protein
MIQLCIMSSHTKGFFVSFPMPPLGPILGKYSARYGRLKLEWYSGIASTADCLINFMCFMIFGPLYHCCFHFANVFMMEVQPWRLLLTFKAVKEAHSQAPKSRPWSKVRSPNILPSYVFEPEHKPGFVHLFSDTSYGFRKDTISLPYSSRCDLSNGTSFKSFGGHLVDQLSKTNRVRKTGSILPGSA